MGLKKPRRPALVLLSDRVQRFGENSVNQFFMAEKGLGCYCFGFVRAGRFHQIQIDTARSLSSREADEENETD